ncbi:nucleotidyltransferase-like protein [Paenibacillus sp. GCM10023252]|uniref:nucleotidyltransferase-like protein n=1 Tax=Paenibacillus sp. GCM10023252 TaxID=3252649 RepID=UPI00361AFE32
MEQIKQFFMKKYESQSGVISVAAVSNPYPYNPLIEGLDLLVLVVAKQGTVAEGIEHVRVNGDRILIRTMDPVEMERLLASGENRSIIRWIVRGEIMMDRDGYLENLRVRIMAYPKTLRDQKQFVEFAGFLRTYLQAKHELQDRHLLDAHSHILAALHHWAHIALIEEGQHPELTVWRQMRRFDPGIYKLYEELTVSPETLEQRVKLVMLACEFAVMNKMRSCCTLLLDILASREEPWSIAELQRHPLIEHLHVDLSLILQKLVKRSYIREVAVMASAGQMDNLELRYKNIAI